MSNGSRVGAAGGVGNRVATPLDFPGGGKSWDYFRASDKFHWWSITDPNSVYNNSGLGQTLMTGMGGQLRAQPNVFARAGQITDLIFSFGANVAIGSAPLIRFAIYDSNSTTLFPVNKLWDSGSIAFNTTVMPSGSGVYRLRPLLEIPSAGIYYLAWTINSACAGNSIACFTSGGSNVSIGVLGAQDRGLVTWPVGYTFVSAPAQAFRPCFQWVQQVYAYPTSGFDAVYPGTAQTSRMADGASTLGIAFGGSLQIAGGGLPILCGYKFTPR